MEPMRATASRQELIAVTIGVTLILAVIVYFGFRNTSDRNTSDDIASLTTTENVEPLPTAPIRDVMERFFAKSALFVDIRSEKQFKEFHIPGSLSVPFDSLSSFTPPENSQLVIVWSQTDRELADAAVKKLQSKKAPFVFIEGGIEGWINGAGMIITIGDPTLFTDQSKVTLVDVEKFKELSESQNIAHLIIDVREKELYNRNHIAYAVNIPLSDLERRYDELPAATNLLVYGGTELESFQAAVRLFDLNFFSVRGLKGGFGEWEKKSYPVESSK